MLLINRKKMTNEGMWNDMKTISNLKKKIKVMKSKETETKVKVPEKTLTKVTPLHDFSWYLKWLSCILILSAVCFRASGGEFHMFDLYFSLAGTLGWLWVGILWHDRALMVLNSGLAIVLLTGILRTYV
tara:strand:- start:1928 stop:2314 length:387 start_codon:yes stop_codon:yes gene_type:complete